MGLFKKKKKEAVADNLMQNSENKEGFDAQKIAERRKQLEKDKFLLEEERKQLDADDSVMLVEKELEKIQVETKTIKAENKRRWNKVWITCGVLLILGIVGNLFVLIKLTSNSNERLQLQEQELQKQLEQYTKDCQQQEALLQEQIEKLQ